MPLISSFDYFANDKTNILVIGTMPGIQSLEKNEYYANNQNVFWKIISITFNNSCNFPSYNDKLNCLSKHQIGLWDNLKYCERDGSLDTNIKNEFPNDFRTLFNKYRNIKRLLFNGNKSHYFFKKYNFDLLNKYEYFILPSTSPANARMNFDDKLKIWQNYLIL